MYMNSAKLPDMTVDYPYIVASLTSLVSNVDVCNVVVSGDSDYTTSLPWPQV